MDLGLQGRAAIVTGGSRGLGLATAKALAAEGAHVLICARDAEVLARAGEEVAAAGRDAGARAISAALDVTEPDAGERLVAAAVERFGAVDILVNNAGTSGTRPLDELTDADWRGQHEIHVMAPMRLMRAAAPGMAERGWGRIVNVCSSSGKRPSLRNAAYSVAKSGQLALSRHYADAYAGRGVLVNAVAPGPLMTELWTGPDGNAAAIARKQGISQDEALAQTAATVPRGAFGTVDEVAAVIAFLCSERAANVAGAAWSVDGGTVASIV